MTSHKEKTNNNNDSNNLERRENKFIVFTGASTNSRVVL